MAFFNGIFQFPASINCPCSSLFETPVICKFGNRRGQWSLFLWLGRHAHLVGEVVLLRPSSILNWRTRPALNTVGFARCHQGNDYWLMRCPHCLSCPVN